MDPLPPPPQHRHQPPSSLLPQSMTDVFGGLHGPLSQRRAANIHSTGNITNTPPQTKLLIDQTIRVIAAMREREKEKKTRSCSSLPRHCCCPSSGCDVHQHQQPGELRRVKSLRISVNLRSPLREEKLLLLLLAAGWRLSDASLLHGPASLPVSQQLRPSQMLHGGAGDCHSTPYAPNTSQLLHAWTTTTVANSSSLPDSQIIYPFCPRANRIVVSLQWGNNNNNKPLYERGLGQQEQKVAGTFFLEFPFRVLILNFVNKVEVSKRLSKTDALH